MLLLFLKYYTNSIEALGVIQRELQVLNGRVATQYLLQLHTSQQWSTETGHKSKAQIRHACQQVVIQVDVDVGNLQISPGSRDGSGDVVEG